MSDLIRNYVLQQLSRAENWARATTKANSKNPLFKRHKFMTLSNRASNFMSQGDGKEWFIVPGLRGVGKSTLMAQVYMHLRQQNVDQKFILYFSTDHVTRLLRSNLHEVFSVYEEILGTPFESATSPIFLLVDEVQYDENWAVAIKSVFDRASKIFIISTGSSALALQTNADVVRRSLTERLLPMSFIEYEMVRNNHLPVSGLKDKVKAAIFDASTASVSYQMLKMLQSSVDSYWVKADKLAINHFFKVGSFPFTIHLDPTQAFQKNRELLDKIIERDIPQLGAFDAKSVAMFQYLLMLVAGGVYTISKLSAVLGIHSNTIRSMIDALVKAEVLMKVSPVGSPTSKMKKASKYYFTAPSMRLAYLDIGGNPATESTLMGGALEDYAATVFDREIVSKKIGNIQCDPKDGSADFLLQLPGSKSIAVEVGLNKKSSRQVRQTIKDRGSDFGVVITNAPLALSNDGLVVTIPIDFFVLM